MEPTDIAAERVLFVHAHPDDETITTGGTIATLVDRGCAVTVLTCTRGELGEVIPADLQDLEGAPELADHRAAELASAMAILGVRDHRFLGDTGARWGTLAPRRYTDSGMRWGASGAEPAESIPDDSLCAAPFADVAADIAAVIEATGPTAVVSYDSRGGYGHPDHIRAREASRRAADVMGVPFFEIDERGELAIDTAAVEQRKTAALAAYRSQLTVDGDRFTLSSGPSHPIGTVERFTRVYADGRSAIASSGTWAVPWKEQGLGVHLLAYALAIIVGVALGAISTVEHRWTATISGVSVPFGTIATLAIAAALLVGCRLVFGGRLVTLFAAIGLIGGIGLLSFASAGEDLPVPVNDIGYLLIFGPGVIALVVLLWPTSRTTSRDRLGGTAKPKGTSSS